mmetsp:Transcript_90170/g.227012  ORF Transcript_90170/g.227012 Transcript_90170/m.227012 type:complete len:457 (-) Transcript_90170:116-1486(-)
MPAKSKAKGRRNRLGKSKEQEEGEEDGEDEESDDMVGYLEDAPSDEGRRLLTRWMFPSKVGGRPAWLVPRSLPSAVTSVIASSSTASGSSDGADNGTGAAVPDLGCTHCGRPLRFLMQIYASRGSASEGAFHRALFLFICTGCQPNRARLFRSQLPWENDFYSTEPPNAKEVAKRLRKSGDQDSDLDAVCCRKCGLPCGAAVASGEGEEALCCGECARRARLGDGPALFQERELRTEEAETPEEPEEDEDEGAAKSAKPATNKDDEVEEVFTPGAAKAAGKDRDLVAEAEGVIEAARMKGASEAVIKKLEEYRTKVAESSDNAIDATEQAVFDEYSKQQGEHDPVFSKFNRFAAVNNGHAVRYNFNSKPLWFCGPNQMDGAPAPCPHCGEPRVFEFQVQPQLISLLHGTSLADRLEFGTMCCYTCRASCDPPQDRPYVEEFVYVQAEPREAWLPKA